MHPDKVLCFQGLYGFWRECSSFLNDCKTIENTGQIGFLGISDDSSQIVVTVISLQKQHFRKNIKTRCLQNYKQRIFICRSIIKIVSNHILGLLADSKISENPTTEKYTLGQRKVNAILAKQSALEKKLQDQEDQTKS